VVVRRVAVVSHDGGDSALGDELTTISPFCDCATIDKTQKVLRADWLMMKNVAAHKRDLGRGQSGWVNNRPNIFELGKILSANIETQREWLIVPIKRSIAAVTERLEDYGCRRGIIISCKESRHIPSSECGIQFRMWSARHPSYVRQDAARLWPCRELTFCSGHGCDRRTSPCARSLDHRAVSH